MPISASAEIYLLMVEEDGCLLCEKWNESFAHIYPKTAERKVAPLLRYDLPNQKPDVEFKQRVHYPPIFVLAQDNKEVRRIEGYPGEDAFWGLQTMMFKQAKIPLELER